MTTQTVSEPDELYVNRTVNLLSSAYFLQSEKMASAEVTVYVL